jgi:chemotaxis-related protein WspB
VLYLIFKVGPLGYALPARLVEEVVPAVPARPLAGMPGYVLGVIDYRGRSLPVVDLGLMLGRGACASFYSTRIVVVRLGEHWLGLRAEEVTSSMRLTDSQFQPAGVAQPGAPFLGPVADVEGQLFQRVDPEQLLPAEVQASLFAGTNA